MKIQICSDLHLEFSENRAWLEENPLIVGGEVLIIAGDTYYLERDYNELEFIDKVSDFWIYGHSHGNKVDFTIGNTTMITNPLGYVESNEHHSFDRNKVIEI